MTNILKWDRPKKVMTVEEWANNYGFEDGPTGGYAPNMSVADQLSWKAKITGTKLGFPQVEIRKKTQRGSQVLIIVNMGEGYNYKSYEAINKRAYSDMNRAWFAKQYGKAEADDQYNRYMFPTRGINIHISTNGPIQMDFAELADMNSAIEEAKTALLSLTKEDKTNDQGE